ncbi:MAG: response regulator [Candidatus Omnitrophica bacterium]|nr:response regulator [Candidatus Omnitrophota bacterium]
MAKKRILIVDDEESLTRVLKYSLEETGTYEVGAENKAGAALATAKTFKPDLILLDVIMPELDGGQLAEQFKADPALHDVPIVFLTAITDKQEVRAHQHLLGGSPFLAKPVELDEVIACLEQQLGRLPPQ